MPRLSVKQIYRLAHQIKTQKPVQGQRFSIEAPNSPYKEAKIDGGRITLFKVDTQGKETATRAVLNYRKQALLKSKISS